ncbi:MAG: hypothetical protein HY800_07650 [Ignavibacteriales bacterium]|nr:hypothetical protein [Ignavibacteriales bacterium]
MKKYQIMVIGIAIIVMIAGALQTMQGSLITWPNCIQIDCEHPENYYPTSCIYQCWNDEELKYVFATGVDIGYSAECCSGRTDVWCTEK